jgi:hypothetical protein
MKNCKKCPRQISIVEEYCSECLKNLSLREKLIEALRREHFFQSDSTNRSFGNFLEYSFTDSENQRFSPSNFSTKSSVNSNIMPNLWGELQVLSNLNRGGLN